LLKDAYEKQKKGDSHKKTILTISIRYPMLIFPYDIDEPVIEHAAQRQKALR
jgi:hypothetical protein